MPGTPHFAHAGDVAWAITNAMADYQDLSDDPADPEFEPGLRLRNASTVLGDLGFEALLPLLRARTVDDVDRALDHWVEPVNNAVIADRHGTVRYRLAGKVPVRDEAGAWTGWLADVHRQEIGPDGQVVTANERRGPQSSQVGSTFAAPYRARRLHELLAGRDDLTPDDFREFHNDTLLRLRRAAAPAGAGGVRRLGLPDGRRLIHRGSVRRVAFSARSPDRRRAGLRAAPPPGALSRVRALAGPDDPSRALAPEPGRRGHAVRHRHRGARAAGARRQSRAPAHLG